MYGWVGLPFAMARTVRQQADEARLGSKLILDIHYLGGRRLSI
jgi:hypothetical protein